MNKNTKRKRDGINKANIGAKRLSTQAKVARKEPTGDAKGPSIMDQMRMLGNYKNASK
jgi:hypothetical protein